jgi:hypothetical protein
MYVSLEKLSKAKVYYNSDIVIKSSNPSNIVNVAFTDGLVFDSFETAFNQIFFTPSNIVEMYYPKEYFNLQNGALLSKTQERNEFFKELKERKLKKKFIRIDDIKNIKIEKSKTPILINLSKVQSDIIDFISKNKKTNNTLFEFVYNTLEKYFIKDIPVNIINKNVFFVINNSEDILVKFILYGIKYKYKDLNKLFTKSNLIFINPFNRVLINLDLDNKNNIGVANLFSKFLALCNKLNKDEIHQLNYIEIPKKEEFSEEELVELPTKDSDILDDEEEKLKDDDNNELTEKELVEINKLKEKEELLVAEDSLDVRNVEPILDISFDEISSTSLDNEINKTEKDNQEFLKRMQTIQEKALKDFEEKANKLSKDTSLDPITANDASIINEGSKKSTTNSINLSYYRKQHLKDFINIIKSLNNDPEYPVIVSKLEITPNSNPLNLQDEVAIQFIDKKGKRHSFVVDIPKLSHDGYLYYNGTKKFITKQATYLPVIKESDERVQIITNYKKCFIYRKGDKINRGTDRVLRFILNKDYPNIEKVFGNSRNSNINFDISLEYNYLATKLFSCTFDKNIVFVFSQKIINSEIEKEGLNTFDSKKFSVIGYTKFSGKKNDLILESKDSKREIFLFNIKSKTPVKLSNNLSSYFDSLITKIKNDDIIQDYRALANSKSMSYTEIKIASTSVSLAVLVCFYKGLISALDLYKIKYTVEDRRRALHSNYEVLFPFKDQYVYVDSEGDTAKDLFINGLMFLETKEYNLIESERLGSIYFEYFSSFTGSRNTAKALLNFEASMIDPITLDVLRDYNLPETFVELVLYGNSLLTSYKRTRKNDLNNFRIRSSEVINVAFYNTMMTAFNNYKRTSKTGIVAPITPPSRQAVMKELSENPNIEGYSVLNPFYEIEMASKVSYKGPSGINSDDAYTAEIRSYDKSMEGLFGFYTPVSAAVGVNRSISMNPKIKNTRGYLNNDFKTDTATQDNMLTTGELLNIYTTTHTDPMRLNKWAVLF